MASALSEVDISDANHLRSLLNQTNDPLRQIADFEKANRINLVSLNPALPLLDLHNVSRNEFHQSVFDQLKLVLERRIEDFSKKSKEDLYAALNKILDKAFPLAAAPSLQPFVMRMLSKLNTIPQDKLDKIMADPQLYKNTPLAVRRHIWLSKPDLFRQEVQQEIKKFVENVEPLVSNFHLTECPVLRNPRDKRANCPILKIIVEMTSGNSDLYKNAVQAIKDEFIESPLHAQPFVASLRSGLLMALHDSEFQEMVGKDEIYKFAWCMDACIRANSIDEKQQRELSVALNYVRRSSAIVDASMILFDPSGMNLILIELEKELRQILKAQSFPRNSEKVDFLLRCLKLGTLAPEMAEQGASVEPSVDRTLSTKLLTSIVHQMALVEEEELDQLIKKVSDSPDENGVDENQNISSDFWQEQMSLHGRLAGQIFRMMVRSCKNFTTVLPLLGRYCRDMLSDQIFLFEVGGHLVRNKAKLNEDIFQKTILKFFVSGKQPREISAKFAIKILESLGDVITPEFQQLFDEKMKKSKDKDKKKKKEKKEDDETLTKDKSGKVSKKKGKKKVQVSDSLKLTLKNLA